MITLALVDFDTAEKYGIASSDELENFVADKANLQKIDNDPDAAFSVYTEDTLDMCKARAFEENWLYDLSISSWWYSLKTGKGTNEDAKYIIKDEGVDYAVTCYVGGDHFADPKTAHLWNLAEIALNRLTDHVERKTSSC